MSASSQMKEVRRALARKGFVVSRTHGGHWRFEHPAMIGPVFAPGTPSDYRSITNFRATLRRKIGSTFDL